LKHFWRRPRPNRPMDRRRKRHPMHRMEIRLVVAHKEHAAGRLKANLKSAIRHE
jgi:hypothetical protein